MNHARILFTLKRDLQIVAWNADSIYPKTDELREFLARLKPDVLLRETHLTPGTVVRLSNYVLHRDDSSNRPGGGTAIEVKTSISHNRVILPPLAVLEATAVELPGVLGGVLLVSGYKPPQSPLLATDLLSIFDA